MKEKPFIKKAKKKLTIKPKKKTLDCKTLISSGKKIKRDLQNPQYLDLLKCMSAINKDAIIENKINYDYLYPNYEDPLFNLKISNKKEFYDTKYEEKTSEEYKHIDQVSQELCDNTEFELEPHQMFVRNFLSFQTPYNSLLLFHGLGTGKTCSAISVCEEMRTYNKQMGNTKRIIIVASPAVQENFKIQLFDERKLKDINGLWNIKACIGNKFLKEINPMNMKGLSRARVIKQIKRLINQSYLFQGYTEFSNYITRIINKTLSDSDSEEIKKNKIQRSFKREFSNRMLVIDEVHNLRINDEGEVKQSSKNLLDLVSYANNIKLMILSATPMFNSYTEIIWLLNLLNLNDDRYPISEKEVFDSKGNFKIDKKGREIGKELLIQKSVGYISYVRGDNPFTFPNSIWPFEAGNPNSLKLKLKDGWSYPSLQINGALTIPHINLFDLVITEIGEYQSLGYNFIIETLKKKYPALNDPKKGLSYTYLEPPLQALNIIYPYSKLDERDDDLMPYLYGGKGLARVMNYDVKNKSNFRYKDKTLKEYGHIFSYEEIGKYSGKIKSICDSIKKSTGIVFIYSQYIDGGAVPIALTLEELGITRYGDKPSLFDTPPVQPIDAITLKSQEEAPVKYPAKYIMITGDKNLTGDVKTELKAATGENNINGEVVKIIIVSRAGSEGLDFKNIRQMHILDPWYNYNRQKQIIGRAVRNFSHCALPYQERNVEIYLYGTELKEKNIESVDLYIYRLAEKKAKRIAKVTRILKENAVDCLLNNKALNFSQEKINKVVKQKLSTGNIVDFHLGDRDNSDICDFTKCVYECNPVNKLPEDYNDQTYNESFIIMNLDKILQRIRLLFKERYIYKKNDLIKSLRHFKNYPLDQIYSALTFLINEKNEYITDILGRLGYLVNIGDYYMFQPVEIDNKHISRYERVHPLDFKRKSIKFVLPEQIPNYSFIPPSEDGLSDAVSISSSLLQNIRDIYDILQKPSDIGSQYKNNWGMHCAHAINSLVKYNKWNKDNLLKYALNHVLDSLNFNEKIILLNYITHKEDKDKFDELIESYFKMFMIAGGRYKGIVMARFDKPSNFEQYTILTKKDRRWINDKKSIVGGLGVALFSKFQILDIKKMSNFIGFMTNFKGNQIVFKTKYIKESDKGRSNKGQRCDRGVGKTTLVKIVNSLLEEKNESKKYKIGEEHKSSIYAIYGERIDRKKKINSFQLCVEIELILRHFNEIEKDGKYWFFPTVSSIINEIEKLKIN